LAVVWRIFSFQGQKVAKSKENSLANAG